jgi:hypothetical protein
MNVRDYEVISWFNLSDYVFRVAQGLPASCRRTYTWEKGSLCVRKWNQWIILKVIGVFVMMTSGYLLQIRGRHRNVALLWVVISVSVKVLFGRSRRTKDRLVA